MRLIPPQSCAEVMVRRASVPGDDRAAGAARRFLRAALADWAELGLPGDAGFEDRVADDATLLISELVTNAVVHARTEVDILCRLEGPEGRRAGVDQDGRDAGALAPGLVIEVADRHPARVLRCNPEPAPDGQEGGRGLQLVAALSDMWGVTFHRDRKTVWCRIDVTKGPEPAPDTVLDTLPVPEPDQPLPAAPGPPAPFGTRTPAGPAVAASLS